jgi:hypothetical protein
MNSFRYSTLAACVLCAMAWSTAGQAQTAGVYNGTSADGQPVTFTVGTDGNGQLAIISAGISFSAPCKGGTMPTLDSAWGFGADSVIAHNKATMVAADPYFYITANFVFSGSSVSGNIATRTPDLDPGNAPPKKADFCESPRQAYSATLSGAAAHSPTPDAVTHFQAAH